MSTNSIADRLPFGAGAGAGVGAYLLGYLVTYLGVSGSVEEQLQGYNFVANVFGGDPIPTWQAVGWVFYNAHFVATRIQALGTRSENFVAASDQATAPLLYLLPVVFLVAAGLVVARAADAEEPADGATAGAAVALGYFPLAVVGALLFDYQGTIAPALVTAVLLAGAVYPLVFGAIGGALGSAVGD